MYNIKVTCALKWARKLSRKTETYESAKCVPCNTRKCTHNGFVSVLLKWVLSAGFMQPGPDHYNKTGTLLVALSLACLEPKGLGDKFCCQRLWWCYVTFSFNVNTQNVKIARRDRPHIRLSFTPVPETFKNLLHIDNAPVRRPLSGNWNSMNASLMHHCVK